MKLLISTIAIALAATACVKQGQVAPHDAREPVQLRSLCHDAKFSDVCTPGTNEMPSVIDINLAIPAAFHKNVG
jgi:hypothetical protein